MRRLASVLGKLTAALLIGLVHVYQWTLSPLIGRQCRFEPTCSAYFILAVRKYGAIRGAYKGLLRIGRCHPFHPGGYDPP
jgi:putative membrane protein insertion efficiency factor